MQNEASQLLKLRFLLVVTADLAGNRKANLMTLQFGGKVEKKPTDRHVQDGQVKITGRDITMSH